MTNDNCNPSHVAWSKRHFAMMRDGGSWALPSSGLIFMKRKERLELVARMPHDPAMPMSAAELRELQDTVFEDTKVHFGAAGIFVIDMSKEGKT